MYSGRCALFRRAWSIALFRCLTCAIGAMFVMAWAQTVFYIAAVGVRHGARAQKESAVEFAARWAAYRWIYVQINRVQRIYFALRGLKGESFNGFFCDLYCDANVDTMEWLEGIRKTPFYACPKQMAKQASLITLKKEAAHECSIRFIRRSPKMPQ